MIPHEGPGVLSSWKEVAAYLGKGVRTVQRWETIGLPVRRPPNRQSIFVDVGELNRWLNGWERRREQSNQLIDEAREIASQLQANIRVSRQLKQANRDLLDEVRHGTSRVFRECDVIRQVLRGNH